MIVLLHAGYWLLYILLVSTYLLAMPRIRPPMAEVGPVIFWSPFTIFYLMPGVLGFYSFYTILFERWLIRKQLLMCLVMSIVLAVASGILTTLVLYIPHFNTGHLRFPQVMWMALFLGVLAGIHGIIGLVLKGFIRWYGEIRLKEELQQRNHETELALIKSQINPHFLFNTINNIDVLIEKDAAKASLFLNKLSGIMRFMLYETRSEKIPLIKELGYIDEYLDLQRIRSANANFVQYEVQGDPGNLMIAPMILISYIENAFKHAALKREGVVVEISLDIKASGIKFCCANKYTHNGVTEGPYKGLGNELLRRRLELLYPEKHRLDISDLAGVYTVTLTLDTYED